MAHITRFRVEGLAGRTAPIERELDRHVNVFFGLNGSGKTSLLRILDSGMSGDASTLLNVPFRSAEVAVYSKQFDTTFTRRIDKEKLLASPPASRDLMIDVLLDESGRLVSTQRGGAAWDVEPHLPPNSQGKWRHVYLPISRMYARATRPAGWQFARPEDSALSPEEQLNADFARDLLGIWREYFATVLNNVREAQAEGLANILQAVLSPKDNTSDVSVDPELAFRRVRSFLRRQGSPQLMPAEKSFVRRLEKDERLRSIVADINQVEERITQAMASRTRLQDLISKLFQGKRVEFGEATITVQTEDNSPIDLGLLSSGEKQVLRLLVEALRAGDNTLLIDEPELSMHVDWQQDLIASMRRLNPDAQVIVATHSPEVMAEVNDRFIFRV